MKLLFIGDIFAKVGRKVLRQNLEDLRREHGIDVTIVNGENAAGGFGITREIAEEFFAEGIDLITTGNHIWSKRETQGYLDQTDKLLRPHNMPRTTPGTGVGLITERVSRPVGVINLIGRVFMANYDCPFRCADQAIENLRKKTPIIIVDFHAEATSEKRALGWYLDGRVTAVLGTHTHVQTADDEVLPQGTGYITDVGMTGPHESVIGVEKETIIERFLTQMPMRYQPATNDLRVNGVVLDVDEETGRCKTIKRISVRTTTK